MADNDSAGGGTAGNPSGGDAFGALAPEGQPLGQQRQSQPTGSAAAANHDADQPDGQQGAVREGASERGGEGGYGNDTGFATGTEAPRDADAAGRSQREQQTSDTYRDAGQGRRDEGQR